MTGKKKIKICMVSPLFPPEYAGGGKQAYKLIRNLGKNIQVIVITGTERNSGPIISQEEFEDIPVYRMRLLKISILGPLIYMLTFIFLLFKNVRKYDILHIHGVRYYTLLGIIFSKLFGKKIISKMTLIGSDDLNSINRRFLGPLQNRLLRRLDYLIAISTELKQIANNYYFPKKKLIKIPNGIEMKQIDKNMFESRKYLGLPRDKKIILFVGLISNRKGVDFIYKLWIDYYKEDNGVQFLLVGPKTQQENLNVDIDLTKKLEKVANKNLILTGYTDEIEEYFNAADLFIFPSRREGLPNVCLEALSFGLPIIVNNTLWAQDIVDNGKEGYRLSLKTELWQDKIKLLLNDQELYREMSHRSYEKSRKFKVSNIAKEYRTLYEELLSDL